MSALTANHPTLSQVLWTGSSAKPLRWFALMVVGSIILTISAKISIPFYPVPMTLQSLAVLAIGMAYGWRLGGATVLLYLAEGAMGLPVFSGTPQKGIGVAYMMGTTGGYLLGFWLAAMLCGWLAERGWDRNVFTTGLAMFFGYVLIYVPGLLWLGMLVGWDKPVLEWGMTPFLYGDALELMLVAVLAPTIWRLLGKSRDCRV